MIESNRLIKGFGIKAKWKYISNVVCIDTRFSFIIYYGNDIKIKYKQFLSIFIIQTKSSTSEYKGINSYSHTKRILIFTYYT